MKTIKILDAVLLAAGAQTNANTTEIDLDSQSLDREFVLSAKIVENATAPGVGATVTVNYYWSNERIADLTTVPTVLSGRKNSAAAITRTNTASSTTHFSVVTIPIRPLARWLYVTLDKSTEALGSQPTITLWKNRVPSQMVNL